MKWKKGRDKSGKESDWFIYSDEGYKIGKYMVMKEAKYAAFTPESEPLGVRLTSKECKELCEAHYVRST